MPPERARKPPAQICNGRFDLDKKLGQGCFAEVYLAVDNTTGEKVAVKCEETGTSTSSQLACGNEILTTLARPRPVQGFVETFYFGKEGSFNCLVMELLGMSLEDRVQKCQGKLTTRSTVLVAQQVLHRIEYLHSKGYVHRDIKPENFMFGIKDKAHHVYLIDFGLSTRYWDDKNKQHKPERQKQSLTGTARYVSINAHKGVSQSRRDDLESIGHMFMYLLRGSLPWSGLNARDKTEKYRKIMETKEQTRLQDLCRGYPDGFQTYLTYCRQLKFLDRPDYNKIQELFVDVRRAHGPQEDVGFEWNEGRSPSPVVPLRPREIILQPDDLPRRRTETCSCGGCFAFLKR